MNNQQGGRAAAAPVLIHSQMNPFYWFLSVITAEPSLRLSPEYQAGIRTEIPDFTHNANTVLEINGAMCYNY